MGIVLFLCSALVIVIMFRTTNMRRSGFTGIGQ
jgi:cbb3-type cytochrome oxidase subunit 3